MNADMYKKDLQLLPADSMENNNGITIEESVSKKGNFNITQYALKKLIAGKKLQLTLSLNPVNRRMMIPSRMIPVCIISMK